MDERYDWPRLAEFVNRRNELARLERWWEADERMPLNLYGRRRVGKSWLLRRFAHGKPAALLVAHRLSAGAQLSRFAEQLEPLVGVRPELPDVASLIRVLFRAARDRKILAAIDEFPWLLPGTAAGDERVLSQIQAVMEAERDASQLKLVLCGSQIGQMESLLAERSPLHGRLIALQLRPLPYAQAALFLSSLDPVERFERFAIAGGMPRYLGELAAGPTRDAVRERVLDRDAPLWDEGRVVLEQELRDSRSYFAILAALSSRAMDQANIASQSHLPAATVSKYLQVLADLRIVRRDTPVGAGPGSRAGRWRITDPFLRFWFRFVFGFQDELETGLSPGDLYDTEVAPALADHVAPAFEDWCREWTRAQYGTRASQVGSWWGPALHERRRSGERFTEQIDVVGLSRGAVTVVGEAKWRNRASDASVLADLELHKLPAMRQAGYRIAGDYVTAVFSKSGYTPSLQRAADASHGRVHLVDVPEALGRAPEGA